MIFSQGCARHTELLIAKKWYSECLCGLPDMLSTFLDIQGLEFVFSKRFALGIVGCQVVCHSDSFSSLLALQLHFLFMNLCICPCYTETILPYLTPQYEFSKVFHGNVVMPVSK